MNEPSLAAPATTRRGVIDVLRRWGACIAVAAILVPILLIQPWKTYLNQGPIRSDGLGYFSWTRAVLDADLNFCRYPAVEQVSVVKVPRPTKDNPAAFRCTNRYPPGLAILQFPVMAPLAFRLDDTAVVTSAQHEASLWFGGLALLGVCVTMTVVARRLGATGWGVQVAVLAFVFGAGLFPYATYYAAFVHVHVAFFVALLLYAGVRTHQDGRGLVTGLAGAISGFFIVATRNVDVAIIAIFVVAFAVWGFIERSHDLRAYVRRTLIDIAPVVAGVVAAVLIQLIVNHHMIGRWVISSYGPGEDFVFDHSYHRQVLFSYDRGLFVYAPVVFITLVAGVATGRTRALTAVYATMIGTLTLFYGFWFQWQLGAGAGFGHRGFVEIAPVGMLMAAMVLSSLRGARKVVFGGIAIGAALWTVQLMLLMWNIEYPEYIANSEIYWGHTIGSDSLLARLFG